MRIDSVEPLIEGVPVHDADRGIPSTFLGRCNIELDRSYASFCAGFEDSGGRTWTQACVASLLPK